MHVEGEVPACACSFSEHRDHDLIAPRHMADRLRLPISRLAKLAYVNRDTMTSKPDSPAV